MTIKKCGDVSDIGECWEGKYLTLLLPDLCAVDVILTRLYVSLLLNQEMHVKHHIKCVFMYCMLVFNGLSDQLQIADGLTFTKCKCKPPSLRTLPMSHRRI